MLKGTAIRSWSYHYTLPQKTKIIYFWSYACMWASNLPATGCACAFFVSEMSVVPQPIGIRVLTSWPIVVFGSVPALLRSFLVRRHPFSVISNHHAEAKNWKRASRWRILSTTTKKSTPTFLGRALYRKVSVCCMINVECQACEVQRLLLQFLGLFCRPWRNVQRRTTRQLENVTSTKEKR